jgi:protease I
LVRKEKTMAKSRILMIVGDYVEDYEAMVAFQALQMVGHVVHAVCPNKEIEETVTTAIHDYGNEDTYTEKTGHDFTLNETFDDVDVTDYDALILPGGRSPEYLRGDEEVLDMVRYFSDKNKPIAAISHGVQILISADVLEGKRCTGHPSLEKDISNAGAEWVDIDIDDALVDGNLVTAQTWVANTEWLANFLEVLETKIEP